MHRQKWTSVALCTVVQELKKFILKLTLKKPFRKPLKVLNNWVFSIHSPGWEKMTADGNIGNCYEFRVPIRSQALRSKTNHSTLWESKFPGLQESQTQPLSHTHRYSPSVLPSVRTHPHLNERRIGNQAWLFFERLPGGTLALDRGLGPWEVIRFSLVLLWTDQSPQRAR